MSDNQAIVAVALIIGLVIVGLVYVIGLNSETSNRIEAERIVECVEASAGDAWAVWMCGGEPQALYPPKTPQ